MDLVNEHSSVQGNKCEVFLSFVGGEDTQQSFASRLYSSLREASIAVLKGDVSLELLLSAIEGCEISIIILSKRYASSKRCLKELTKIMEFRKAHDQVVVPVFYGVLPNEVRNQESSFGEAFQDLVQGISPPQDEVSRWRGALTEVGAIRGFDVPNLESNNESDFQEYIQNIVKSAHYILNTKGPIAIGGLVGVSSQVQEVITMLQSHQPRDVVYVGIWGMGGSGKTTLARLIFDHIHYDFETTCFLSNVGELWAKEGPKSERLNLKERPWKNKGLLVADDVSHLEQLHALCGCREWFGKGSRIIITTRDSHALRAFHQVDHIYPMKLLSDEESLEHFSRNAFKEGSPDQGEFMELLRDEESLVHLSRRNTFKEASPGGEFIELCRRMVAYAEGLPLALEVLSSVMCGISPGQWKLAWMKLSTVLDSRIYDNLKLSYDSLEGSEKEIFLNIVVFYIGEDLDDAIKQLDFADRHITFTIRVLVNRSLLTIDSNNKIRMHNLLQLMGRQVMRESSKNELLNRDHMYEVFLSFRGEDTRTTFTSHLYSALCNAGIYVFKDDIDIPRGNHIKMELLQAIGRSKIAIIILSREYAGSKWCLEELSMIMEFHKSNNQVVLPVFYNVDPSEIRNQNCSFGEAFDNLIQKISPPENQVSNWRAALAEAGGIAGIVVLGSRDESENVQDVVENVCDILDKNDLFVAEHPVGVDDRVQEVIKMLQKQSEDVVMVGIWGMGGIGKTTIAKSIYNEIGRKFESRSYLPKIRKTWNKTKGQVSLQNQLLSEICKTTKMKINSVESGKITLRDRLRHKKALIVLDDVDKLAQLNALVGSRDWFKPGSAIIITTRNKCLLRKNGCYVYAMKNLDERESIKLFSWHAFKQESSKEGFAELSRDIVAYSGGLPLALEVLGSYLFDREAEEWKGVLEKLKIIPHDKIQKKLKISFDGLDALEKEIFLDISFFFIGMDRNDVTHILNDCEFFADIGIKTLMERSLITVDEKNMLGMHDLLRVMGREIVRDYSQNELGKRSRLWFHEDACKVLSEHMGTEAIEGLSLKLSQSKKMKFQTKAFKKMKRLRLLYLNNVQLKGNYKNISKDLRWLCWYGFPIKYIPRRFHQEKLVALDLKYNSLIQVWKEPPPVLERLRILNLSHSPYLMQTPDFSNLPNLETLVLEDCPSLSKIHRSIGLLYKLLLLDLEDCTGLQSLPRSIYTLKCLKTLILSGCVKIEKLEEDIEQMESLTTLIAPTVKKVPSSVLRLKSISYLSICGHEGLSHHVIPSLCLSWTSPTDNSLLFIATRVDPLNISHGPSTISSSEPKQQLLLLQDGSEILDSLCATNCMDISRLENFEHLLIEIGKNSQVCRTLTERISQGLSLIKYSDDCVLPGNNDPYWLPFKDGGASVQFTVPPVNGCNHLKGMTICCVYFPSGDLGNKACESCISCLMIINYTKKTTLVYVEDKLKSMEESERKEIISNLEPDDQVEVKAIFGNGFTVKKTAVYLIYKESFDEQMEPSTSKSTNLSGTKHKCEEEEEEHQPIKLKKAMKI